MHSSKGATAGLTRPDYTAHHTSAVIAAEEYLASRLERTTEPTKYIAGFRTPSGKELALARTNRDVYVWVSLLPPGLRGVTVSNRDNPGQPYAPTQTRNSNLRASTPTLAEGHQAWYVRLDDLAALEQLVEAYG
jgi:hypothetical protein